MPPMLTPSQADANRRACVLPLGLALRSVNYTGLTRNGAEST